jgi:hypothetical protein
MRRSPCVLRCVSSRVAVVCGAHAADGGRFDGVGPPQVIEGRALPLTMDQLSGLGMGDAPRDRVVRPAALS